MQFTLVSEGKISKSSLDSKDGMACALSLLPTLHPLHLIVFILDTGKTVFVWIGNGASKDEKKSAMSHAHVS